MKIEKKCDLVKKYEKLGLLYKVNDEKDKIILSLLYEHSFEFLLLFSKQGNDFVSLYIPLVRKMYLKYGEIDHKKLYHNLKKWLNSEGEEWRKDIKNLQDVDLVELFIQDYKLTLK